MLQDPGIPNAWPFKEELIAQLKAQKEREEAKQRALREQRRAAAKEAREAAAMEAAGQGQQLEAMQASLGAEHAGVNRQLHRRCGR